MKKGVVEKGLKMKKNERGGGGEIYMVMAMIVKAVDVGGTPTMKIDIETDHEGMNADVKTGITKARTVESAGGERGKNATQRAERRVLKAKNDRIAETILVAPSVAERRTMLVLIHITSATDGTRVKRVPVQSRNPGSEIVLALPDLVETKSKTITVNPPKHHHGTKGTGTTKADTISQST
jgi:hypothetical protein